MLSSERTCGAYAAVGTRSGDSMSPRFSGPSSPTPLRAGFGASAGSRIANGRAYSRSFTVLARPVEDVELVFYGDPRAPPPDFGELSRESCRRWNIPSRPVTVIRGTPKLRNIVGGPSRMGFRALGRLVMTLGVSAVCLKLMSIAPELAAGWVCEDGLLPVQIQRAQPDAVIFDPNGEPRVRIEFASGYQAEKFEKIDRTFRSLGIPYAVWMRTET